MKTHEKVDQIMRTMPSVRRAIGCGGKKVEFACSGGAQIGNRAVIAKGLLVWGAIGAFVLLCNAIAP